MTGRIRGGMTSAAAALCAFAAPALAAPPPPYAGVDIGYTFIGLDELPSSGEEGIGSARRDRLGMGFALTLGWRFSPYLAAEGQWIDLGGGGYSFAGESGDDAVIRVRSHGVLLSLAGAWPIDERWSLEGRAGAYFGRTEVRARITMAAPGFGDPVRTSRGSDSSTGVAAGAGVVATLSDTWALRVGYDYFDKAYDMSASRLSLGVRFNWP